MFPHLLDKDTTYYQYVSPSGSLPLFHSWSSLFSGDNIQERTRRRGKEREQKKLEPAPREFWASHREMPIPSPFPSQKTGKKINNGKYKYLASCSRTVQTKRYANSTQSCPHPQIKRKAKTVVQERPSRKKDFYAIMLTKIWSKNFRQKKIAFRKRPKLAFLAPPHQPSLVWNASEIISSSGGGGGGGGGGTFWHTHTEAAANFKGEGRIQEKITFPS